MAEYHKYVFDVNNRTFVGKFEQMYRDEKTGNFDSWHQDDLRQLNRKISLEILGQYNFGTILDIGAGKGILTALLKKNNNRVVGVDISPTAIDVARSRFPDIEFATLDVNNMKLLEEFVRDNCPKVDLVFSAECLSYLSNWRDVIDQLSKITRYILLCLYIPKDPIGFVKSPEQLEDVVGQHFDIIEAVALKRSGFTILFGSNKAQL